MKAVLTVASVVMLGACSASVLPPAAGQGMNAHDVVTANTLAGGAYDDAGACMKPPTAGAESWRLEASAAPTR